jgi:putative addiction module component (TIGR02574 family)
MSINTAELLALPASEQMRIVELLWDQLGKNETPLPDWLDVEGNRRLKKMKANPNLGSDHETVWQRIETRNG